MINITKFKAEIDKKLEASNRDLDWLAEQTDTKKACLAMVLSRKTMKNRTPLLTEVSRIMGVDIPVIEEGELNEPVKDKAKDEAEPVKEETPTLIDDVSPELEMNKKEIWVDGRKYDEDVIRKLLEDGVAEHRKLVELDGYYSKALEQIEKLNTSIQALTDKYIERDKEAIRYQMAAESLQEQINEEKDGKSNTLENMTIGESIKLYRTLKKLFKDEVLQ